MLIGVISDTHGSHKGWEKAMGHFQECEMIFHAGDVLYHGPRNPLPEGYDPKELANSINNFSLPVFIVRGNCDAEVEEVMLELPILSPYFYSYLDGVKILILHGTNMQEEQLAQLGEKYKADVVIFGHIHTPVSKKVGNTVLFNPGSPSLSFNTEPTIGLLDTGMRKIKILTLEKGETFTELSF
ncbi:MAG: phosphodiesterase [Candidatus Syntrophonatronum acetioxidans]|uniref:Phosphoesterase n=1 Tax=Candidatus Syntrophonatronum acetioxidans TaxID=1795816 RepID=A0A424YFJ5_9FIRM|nr:MAG: phosphodiesterase [Candidatus Syntrophonatronum acetioxidans]